jgi:hypothetical protein
MNELSVKEKTTAITVITPNYLAHAFALRNSFLEHNPSHDFIICFIGYKDLVSSRKDCSMLFIDQLEDDRIKGMIQRYNPFELSCALKPFFASHIFTHFPHIERLIYLDADILVFGQFKKISEAAIIISPHRTVNVNYLPGLENFSTISLLRYGVYNAGYFELLRKPEAFIFLKWWQDMMEKYGYDKPDEHLFTDQLWMTAAPSFFDDLFINKNPGYNIAFWNLLERKVTENENSWFVNNEPLVFFHYSKYKIEEPLKLVNFDHPYLSFAQFPELKPVFEKYRKSLLEAGYEETRNLPYPFPFKRALKKKSWWRKLFLIVFTL